MVLTKPVTAGEIDDVKQMLVPGLLPGASHACREDRWNKTRHLETVRHKKPVMPHLSITERMLG
jgi:hypothetical protein